MSRNIAIVPGTTYAEMLDPSRLPGDLRDRTVSALRNDDLDPVNLYNTTWKR